MLFYAHSGLRYLVLLAGVLVLGYAGYGQATKREYDKTMRILAAVFTGAIDLTALVGVAHLMNGVFYPQLSGHIVSMVLAAAVAHIVSGVMKHEKHQPLTPLDALMQLPCYLVEIHLYRSSMSDTFLQPFLW